MENSDKNEKGPVQVVKDILRNLPTGNETAFDVVRECLPDGTSKAVLSVINRRLNPEAPPEPVRAPSPRRVHEFFDVYGFIGYLAKYGGGSTVVLADHKAEQIAAIMDNRAPCGFEVVTFRPQVHPIFQPWKDMVEGTADEEEGGEYIPLRQMADFLAENRRAIIGAGGAEVEDGAKALLHSLRQIKVSRKVDMMQGTGNNSINGIMIELNIAGKASENAVSLPETVVVEAPLYVSRPERQFTFDLTLNASEDGGVVAKLTPGDLLAQRAQEFEQIVAEISTDPRLAELAKAGLVLGLGKPQTAEWQYLVAGSR